MTDVLVTIYYLPLTTYHLLSPVVGLIIDTLPSPMQVMGSFWIFLFLWKPRQILEDKFLKKSYYKRRKSTPPPSTAEHAAAASSVSSLFIHHF